MSRPLVGVQTSTRRSAPEYLVVAVGVSGMRAAARLGARRWGGGEWLCSGGYARAGAGTRAPTSLMNALNCATPSGVRGSVSSSPGEYTT